MQNPVPHIIHDNTFWVSPERCLYWEEESTLIVSDLHLGKTGHFRKSGIAVPQSVYKEDLQRLVALIQHFQPKKLFIAGDMFHSRLNQEFELFKKWREDLSMIDIHLIMGNHDILHENWYREASITVHARILQNAPFQF